MMRVTEGISGYMPMAASCRRGSTRGSMDAGSALTTSVFVGSRYF